MAIRSQAQPVMLRFAFLPLLFSLSCSPVLAQTADLTGLDFEDLATMQVSSASKFLQPLREAPSSVEVISRIDIKRHGWRTLEEALNSLPGLFTTTDKAYGFLGGRGFSVPGDYNTRFLLLLDGIRMTDPAYGQGMFGSELGLDLALVERIEYVPGPGSAIYGGNAIFGVVNIITRKAEEMPPLSASVFVSSDGWREGRVAGAKRYDSGAKITLSYSQAKKLGEDTQYADPLGQLTLDDGSVSPDGIAHGLDLDKTQRLYGRFDNGGLTISGRYSSRTVHPSSALYATLFDDKGLLLEDAGFVLNGSYQKRLSDDSRIEARVDYSNITFNGEYPYNDISVGRYINQDKTTGKSLTGDFRFFYNGFEAHKLLAGIELQSSKTWQKNNDIEVALSAPLDAYSQANRLGAYMQDEWAFLDAWRLSFGLRYDASTDTDSQVSPRLGLIWLPTTDTSIKLLAGSAYRLPTPYERDYGNGVNYLTNPTLKPEQIRTLELVMEQQIGQGQSVKVSVFDYSLKQLIAQEVVAGNSFQYQNGTSVGAQGIETSWRRTWRSNLRLQANLSYTKTSDDQGNSLSYSPRWVAKALGSVPVWREQWWLAAEAYATSAVSYQWSDAQWQQPGKVLVNATLTGDRIWAGLDVTLRVRNLFDHHYAYPASSEVSTPGVPGLGRTFELGLSYSF